MNNSTHTPRSVKGAGLTVLGCDSGADGGCSQAVRVEALVLQDLMFIWVPAALESLSQPTVQLRVSGPSVVGLLSERVAGSQPLPWPGVGQSEQCQPGGAGMDMVQSSRANPSSLLPRASGARARAPLDSWRSFLCVGMGSPGPGMPGRRTGPTAGLESLNAGLRFRLGIATLGSGSEPVARRLSLTAIGGLVEAGLGKRPGG